MPTERTAHIVTDLGFGDAGKGTVTDYLARTNPIHTVVRSNGGAQAGHGVVTPSGQRHTFNQFGSGTFVPHVRTYLSRHFILQPAAMLIEERRLAALGVRDAFARTDISKEALLITPFQRAANRLRELLRGDVMHGSCGIGIGETAALAERSPGDALYVGDLLDMAVFRRKLLRIQDIVCEQFRPLLSRDALDKDGFREELDLLRDARTSKAWIAQLAPFIDCANIVDEEFLTDLCDKPGDIVFEGAQGVLLDERRGFFPHCTRSTCTFENPLGLLDDGGYEGEVRRIGVLRAYATRHGAGPFVTENDGLGDFLPEPKDEGLSWSRRFRVGWPDLVSMRYALESCRGADLLAVTCLDRIRDLPAWQVCTSYDLSRLTSMQREQCFRPDGSIRLGAGDLEHQIAITTALQDVRPVYDDVTDGPDEGRRSMLLARIQDALGVPIKIVSHGPTADDKIEF